uniref:Gamma-tubulin complex component n=1 Tax=Panagrolaimus sp. JU765 TaxID=591449 RepID=A0AC34R9A9_9BILA
MNPIGYWYFRRRKILDATQAKLAVKGRRYELPVFDENESQFENLDPQQQRLLLFKLIKDACLDIFTDAFYPCYNFDSMKGKLAFKVGRRLSEDVKNDVKKLTSMVRFIVSIRTKLGELLLDTTCGLVTRSITEIIYDFMNNEFCDIVDKLFNEAKFFNKEDNNPLQRLSIISTDFTSDCTVLCKKLSNIRKGDFIGGLVISLFDDESELQFSSKSFLPQLFQQCVEAGMKHYNMFLHEFLMFGHVNSDKFREFAIWDLQGTEFKSSDFGQAIDERHETLFDSRFIIIKDLIPSVWKKNDTKDILSLAFKTRRLMFILNSENRKPHHLKPISLEEFSDSVKQFELINQRFDEVNVALLDRINETFSIRELYNFLYKLLFNPSSMWINDFVVLAEELMETDPVPDEFISRLNEYFYGLFRPFYEKLHCRFDLIKLQLYNYSLFDKVLPSDVRLVDYLCSGSNAASDDGVDENNPLVSDSIQNSGEKDSLCNDVSFLGSAASDYQLQLVDQIGIVFHDTLLVKCLIPPSVQEHINKLFRLRLLLARCEYLLTTKRLNKSATYSKMEHLVLFNVQNFLRSYSNTVFGLIVEKQWGKFSKALQSLKGIDNAVDAQMYLLRDIYSPAGLFSRSSAFSQFLNIVLTDVILYCQEAMDFNDFADRFYDNFTQMRRVVHERHALNALSYPVFRIPVDVKQEKWEAIPLDPRKQALAPVQKWAAPIRRSMSYVGGTRRL